MTLVPRIAGAALGLALLALPAAAEEVAPGLSREALRAEIRAYLLENPEVLYEAIQIYEERRRVAEAAAELDLVRALKAELEEDGYSFVENAAGTFTIVEFFDYRCGFCKKAHPEMATLLRTNPDIRIIRKEFPILGPESLLASRAAMAVLMQGPERYRDFHNRLMEFGGPITDAVLDRLAERAGADVARMRADMTRPEIDERLRRNRALAEKLAIQGTPTFIVGDKIVRGFLPLDEMAKVVELARNVAN